MSEPTTRELYDEIASAESPVRHVADWREDEWRAFQARAARVTGAGSLKDNAVSPRQPRRLSLQTHEPCEKCRRAVATCVVAHTWESVCYACWTEVQP